MNNSIIVAEATKTVNLKIEAFKIITDLGYNLIPSNNKKALVEWKPWQTEGIPKELYKQWVETFRELSLNWLFLTGAKPYSAAPGLIVLDGDDELGCKLIKAKCPPTRLAVTTSKGRHFYYRRGLQDKVGTRAKTKIGGKTYNVDIRADGGYAVAPGSMNTTTGHVYQWSQPFSVELIASLPVYDPLWLPHEGSDGTDLDSGGDDDLSHFEAIKRVAMPLPERKAQASEYLDRTPGAVAGQGQGAGAYCLAIAIQLVWGYALPYDVACEFLHEWGQREDQTDSNGYPYHWRWDEIRHKVKDACRKSYSGRIGDKLLERKVSISVDEYKAADEIPAFDENLVRDDVTTNEVDPPRCIKTLWTIDDIRAYAKTHPLEWIMDRWILKRGLHMLSGNSFAGKSVFVAELVRHIAQGLPFADVDTVKTPVVMLDLENDASIIERRMASLPEGCQDITWLAKDQLRRWLPFDAERIREFIELVYRERGYTECVLVIDTLPSAFCIDQYDAKIVNELLYALQRVAQEMNCAIVVLQHRPKSGATYSGHHAMMGALDLFLMYEREPESLVSVLKMVGTRLDHPDDLSFAFDEETRTLTPTITSKLTLDGVIIKIVANCPEGINQTAIVESVQNEWKGTPPGAKKVIAAIKRLAVENMVGRQGANGKGGYLYFPVK